MITLRPSVAGRPLLVWRRDLALFYVGVSGLTAGYFAAWLLRFGLRYRNGATIPTAS